MVVVVSGSPDGDLVDHAYLSELFGHEDQESNHDRVPVVCEPSEGPVDQCTQQLQCKRVISFREILYGNTVDTTFITVSNKTLRLRTCLEL